MKARHWILFSGIAAGAAWLLRSRPAARTYKLVLEPDSPEPDREENSILFIGTATTLIRFCGMTILTDPNFLHRGEQVHIGYGMHSTRLTNPSMNFEDLPPIDFVLLSHLHEDHFDKLVEERLARDTPILTTPAAAASLRRRGFHRVCGLRTWDEVEVSKGDAVLRLTSLAGRHGPLVVSAMMPSVMGSLLEFRNLRDDRRYRIYVSGDTLAIRDLEEIPARYPHIDLALIHLGGTRVMGILLTMNAQQGIEAMGMIRPELTIPIHYNDYDVFKEPLEAFIRAVKAAGWEDRVRYLTHGEAYAFAPNPVETVGVQRDG
jgi:L-ascorbate metabolism protein UlaG (beta-lactamase superfamily)